MLQELNPDKALIFRITHIHNVPWILDHGIHCRTSDEADPNFVQIGDPDLIGKRHFRQIAVPPGGTLSDYVPFYFTPLSPMFYNIITGFRGIRKREREEIVILVSSLPKVAEEGDRFLFTDRHAYLQAAEYCSDLGSLNLIDWSILQRRDFKRDPENDPGKVERYEAEALVHRHVPVTSLLGVACHSDSALTELNGEIAQRELALKAVKKRDWYF